MGHAPLPWEDLERSYGPGTRTWQFASTLLADGHEVVICASRIPFVYPEDMDPVTRSEEHGCVIYRVEQTALEVGAYAAELMDELEPDCVVGATAYPSYIAAVYAGERPLWVDVFGSVMAEAQAKAGAYGDNSCLDHFIRINRLLLEAGDRFSTVSGRQSYELVGQLGITGRLRHETLGYDFACSIPCGVRDIELPPPADPTGGKGTADDFLVLWSGGFNTWTDVGTLLEGMELAMDRSPRIRFVSTGGSIQGHDERTYPKFREMVERSRHRDRFHLLGWVKRSEAMSYYGTASVGINMDAVHYEVAFGSRNRILEWALAGLPAVSTDLCELTGEMAGAGLLFGIPDGDPRALAEKLLELDGDRGALLEAGRRLKGFVLERYSFEATTVPLREWVEEPAHAPDFGGRRAHRLEVREAALSAAHPEPTISADAPALEKLSHYLRAEGPVSTVKRIPPYVRKILGAGHGRSPG
jgi:glycosyltransferase involved in cell wall biosynthesis